MARYDWENWLLNGVTYGFLYGLPLSGFIAGVVLSHRWGHPFLAAVFVCAATTFVSILPIVAFFRWADRSDQRASDWLKESRRRDEVALAQWRERCGDSVFGEPSLSVGVGPPLSEVLENYSGFVNVSPGELPRYERCRIYVYITQSGFTEAQRAFYLRLVHDMPAIQQWLQPRVTTAYEAEFAKSDVCSIHYLHTLRIGEDRRGEPLPVTLTFEYDQDEYVDVDLAGDRILAIRFFM